jgi:hypothetical protein
MRFPAAATLALVLLAAACSRQPAAPQAGPANTPAAAPTPGPGVTPGSTATPGPLTAATASPYHYVITPPAPAPGMPAIVEIDMLEQIIHSGAPYSVRVKTSPDVTAISVSTMGQTYGMQAAGPGLFATDGQVPGGIPFFLLNRSYTLTVTARTADGRTTSIAVDLRLEK